MQGSRLFPAPRELLSEHTHCAKLSGGPWSAGSGVRAEKSLSVSCLSAEYVHQQTCPWNPSSGELRGEASGVLALGESWATAHPCWDRPPPSSPAGRRLHLSEGCQQREERIESHTFEDGVCLLYFSLALVRFLSQRAFLIFLLKKRNRIPCVQEKGTRGN